MRHTIAAFTLLGFMAAVPLASATTPRQSNAASPAKSSSAKNTASHSVRGVVKSVDDSSLVITRSDKKAEDLSFKLDQATSREGTIAVGSTVSVRYRTEGKTLVATAVTPHAAKQETHAQHSKK